MIARIIAGAAIAAIVVGAMFWLQAAWDNRPLCDAYADEMGMCE